MISQVMEIEKKEVARQSHFTVLILGGGSEAVKELQRGLGQRGFACPVAADEDELLELVPDLLLVDPERDGALAAVQNLKSERQLPVIALMRRDRLDSVDGRWAIDDFVVHPADIDELVLRINRLLQKSWKDTGETIKSGDLVIDLAKCEVTVGGRLVVLAFREYELLKFLASQPGRVFTRDALLNKVWGYDYYGGDRTVDVHIRRLRSKIEDPTHAFIETVRNIGYRFKKGD